MGTELAVVFFAAITGGFGIYTTAVALGIRHGIDWDHIAAITDITSTSTRSEDEESWLLAEPGLQLTDESHHMSHGHEDEDISDHDHAHAHGQPHAHDDAPSDGGGVATLARPATIANIGPMFVTAAAGRARVATLPPCVSSSWSCGLPCAWSWS